MPTITTGFLEGNIFRIVSEEAERQGVRAFVIGGYVRDCFLGRANKDIDIVVEGSGIALAEAIGKRVKSKVSVFKNFGTAMLHIDGVEVEFVGARKESYSHDSRKPIVEDGTLEEDQKRRDFTINAMAFSLQKEFQRLLYQKYKCLTSLIRSTKNISGDRMTENSQLLKSLRLYMAHLLKRKHFSWAGACLTRMD